MRGKLFLTFLGVLGVLAGLAWSSLAPDATFPHDVHQGLFPSCLPCHADIPSGDPAGTFTVAPQDCAQCHDGDMLDPVPWTVPSKRGGNLIFDHGLHVGEMEIECETCHQAPRKSRMDVALPPPEVCLECHDAPEHLAEDADCRSCHVPLTEAEGLSAEEIASFPRPGDHQGPEYIFTHGAAAAGNLEPCATCHAREKCEVCHLNAATVASIQGLGSDLRVAELVAGSPGRWPRPPSHQDPKWKRIHGGDQRGSIQSCANCHARSSCTACHGGSGVWEELHPASPGGPEGVQIRRKP